MHNAALADSGIDAIYAALPVEVENLHEAVRGLRAVGYLGLNVTIPHKLGVVELMDELTPLARAVGAVNTIKFTSEGKIIGHNTDVVGVTQPLIDAGLQFEGAAVVVLGAGGAGRSAAAACALAGARKVTVLNRTAEKARAITEEFQRSDAFPDSVQWEAGSLAAARDWTGIDAVLQMTSLGLKGNTETPIDPSLLPASCFVLEAVYAPMQTPFLAASRAKGLRAVDGLAMLIEQGAASLEFWFERRIERSAMRTALAEFLEHR